MLVVLSVKATLRLVIALRLVSDILEYLMPYYSPILLIQSFKSFSDPKSFLSRKIVHLPVERFLLLVSIFML